MHFIFGYYREVPVKIERSASKLVLFGIAILLVLLIIFLSFENLDEEPFESDLVLRDSFNSTQVGQTDKLDLHLVIDAIQYFQISEPEN